jgi:cytochrome c oxidase subunit 2
VRTGVFWPLVVIINYQNQKDPFYEFSPEQTEIGFQIAGNEFFSHLIELHHDIMFILCIIVVATISLLLDILCNGTTKNVKSTTYFSDTPINHNTILEIVWTLIPTMILFLVALPSFSLLYSLDESQTPELVIKVVGNQWYWDFEYPIIE